MKPHKPKPGQSLAELRPELLTEWSEENEWAPWDVKGGSHYRAKWVCRECGHVWLASCNKRTNGRGCPECGKVKRGESKSLAPREKSLGVLYPELVEEWSSDNNKNVFEVYPGSGFNALWECKTCKYNWLAKCIDRSRGRACPSCANKLKAAPREKSLGTLYPELLKEWSDENSKDVFEVYPGSDYRAKWTCKGCGHVWFATCDKRTNGRGCPECGKVKIGKSLSIAPKEKSLGFLYPHLVKEWSEENSKDVFEVYPRSHYKAKWSCNTCGGMWTAIVTSRTGGNGCPACSNKLKVAPREKSLGVLYPELLEEWSQDNSKSCFEVYPSSNYRAKWVCKTCGHSWITYCYSRTSSTPTGCPLCAKIAVSRLEQSLRDKLGVSKITDSKITNTISTKPSHWKVDCLINRTIIEYDGSYWHYKNSSYKRDIRKTEQLLKMGYRVVRIREQTPQYKLKPLNIDSPEYFEINYEMSMYMPELPDDLIEEVKTKVL